MKAPGITMAAGASMFMAGLGMFYSVEMGQTEPVLRFVKNAGIFIGLSGLGAFMAGILLSLMVKSRPLGE